MIICPVVKGKLQEVKNLPKTVRGKGGFGSTGNKKFDEIYKKTIDRYSRQIILKKVGTIGQKNF